MEIEKQIQTIPLEGITESKAEQIKNTFQPMVKMLRGFENDYNDIITASENGINSELSAKAKRLRLDIAKVRIDTGKLKDKQKEYIKLEDKAIMGVYNILVYAVKEKEDKLKEIEKYAELQEQKRLEALQSERAEILSQYVQDAHERDLSSMDEDVWEAYLSSKKKAYEDEQEAVRIAKEEAERKERVLALHNERKEKALPYFQFWTEEAKQINFGEVSEVDFNSFISRLEATKLEHDKKQEAIRLENERLKKEAEAKAKKEAQERKEREEREAKERQAQEAKLKAEREEKERIQRELKQKEEAERKAKEEAERLKQLELQKGDSEKVNDLINDLILIKSKYSFESDQAKSNFEVVSYQIDKITDFLSRKS